LGVAGPPPWPWGGLTTPRPAVEQSPWPKMGWSEPPHFGFFFFFYFLFFIFNIFHFFIFHFLYMSIKKK
jgi:hypothetical protein